MNLKIVITATLMVISAAAFCQSEKPVNQTDAQGRKQGYWIKRNPDKSVVYEGYFKDGHPVGEFKRYYKDQTLKSVLDFSSDGKEASAVLYHPDGYIASKGKYVNQQKEGKWQFFSAMVKDYLIAEYTYSGNLRNGPSVKYYPDSTIAEKVNYINDIKQGEWTRYYPNGSVLLKSNYVNGMLDGKFEAWYENGRIEFSGRYKNDGRDGLWLIYKPDGTIKYRIEYHNGITNDRQMDIDEAKTLDSLETNKGKFEDPEKEGMPQ